MLSIKKRQTIFTCTQERLGQSVKIIANADDICSREQANELKEELGTF